MKRSRFLYTFCEYSQSYDERAVTLHIVAVFSPDYIPGLIIEALNPRGKWLSLKNTEATEGGTQLVKCQDVDLLITLCSKFFLQRTFYSLQKPEVPRLHCHGSSYPVFRDDTGEKWKGRKIRKKVNIFHCLFLLKSQVTYIEKCGVQIFFQKWTFPLYPLLGFFVWFLFPSFYVTQDPALHCLQTPRPVTNLYLDRNPSPFFTHNHILHLQLL